VIKDGEKLRRLADHFVWRNNTTIEEMISNLIEYLNSDPAEEIEEMLGWKNPFYTFIYTPEKTYIYKRK
jgi:hypothetical protein